MNPQAQSVEFQKARGPKVCEGREDDGVLRGRDLEDGITRHVNYRSSSCDAAYRHQSARELKAVVWNAISTCMMWEWL